MRAIIKTYHQKALKQSEISKSKFFYKLHTYLSLLFFIPLAVVCFSGAILVYKDELNSLLAPNVVNVNLNKENLSKRISFDEQREIIASELGGYEMVGINIDANPKNATKFG